MSETGNTPVLGRLAQVPVREVWRNEAYDFTPWLLANADVLSDVLGMDLALSAAEHPVGGYSLDLIGEDTATGDIVIVENQLEGSDHSHLGQVLTYAGGTDAVNVVWVATSFRAEHRAALDWLNTRTDEGTRFFAVEVSAVRIGDSMAAPSLTLVVQPNDWGKLVRSAAVARTSGERAATYRSFWSQYLERVRAEHPGWTRSSNAPKGNWLTQTSGLSAVSFTVAFGRRGLASEVFFEDPEPTTNTRRFEALLARRVEFEAAYGGALTWEDLPDRKGCRVAEFADGSIDEDGSWAEYVGWFLDRQTHLRDAFSKLGGVAAVVDDPSGPDVVAEPSN
jgi:hypothetical protein